MKVFYISILFILITSIISGQTMNYNTDTAIYRYKSSLKDTLFSFSDVNIQTQYFPCVDVFSLSESRTAGATFEMSTETGAREFYSYKDSILSMVAYVGQDPFIGIPAKTIQYYTPIPIVVGDDKREFQSEGISEFVIDYKSNEWPDEIKQWATKKDISIIRINGQVEWDHSFGEKDRYRDLYLDIQLGEMIEYNRVYSIGKVQVKKENWEVVSLEDNPILSKYFKNQRTEHRSFYQYGSIVELARLSIYPTPEFYFQTSENIGRYNDCKHQYNAIYVFPNPTFNDVKIRFENATSDNYMFSLHNVVGRKLWSTDLTLVNSTQVIDIDLPRLDKGIYMYTVRNTKGKIITSKRLVIMEL